VALIAVSWVLLLMRREFLEAVMLAAGLALTYAGVHVTAGALDRSRPPDPLLTMDLSAYPSAHAAYAMTWVAVAVALARVLPSLASRFAFVTVGIVAAAVAGVSCL